MKALVVSRPGGPEVLEVAERPEPQPGERQLRVRVAAAGVNYIDTYQRSGVYPVPTPFVLGLEGAGVVSAVGEEVTDFAVGDRVAWSAALGSYAEEVLVEEAQAVAVPDGVSDRQAAAVMLQGMTAYYLSHSTYPVASGDTALVHAAAGGVGLLLTQFVKARGGRVIATVSTDDKAKLARAAGADEVIRYDEEDFAERARALTGGEGVHVVYDGVGRTTFDGSLASLRRRGMLVLYGGASGPVPPFDPQRLNAGGGLYLTRPSLAHYTATRRELVELASAVLGAVAGGSLEVRVGHEYPLAQARAAHEDLEGRRTTGKLLLLP